MTQHSVTIIVDAAHQGKRLLSFLKENFKSKYSVQDLRYAITRHGCRLNNKVERFESVKVKKDDKIEITIEKKPLFTFDKQRVLFEDEFLCIYDKPAGIAVTEKEGLASLFSLLPAHRLDRDTTGALIFAKSESIRHELIQLFKTFQIEKSYLALVSPSPIAEEGVIEKPLIKVGIKQGLVKWKTAKEGLYAKTKWQIQKRMNNQALLSCQPITGRTHQIRVHLSSMGCPIVGDVHYGSRHAKAQRPLLHAEKLSLIHPITKKKIFVVSSTPKDFCEAFYVGN